jgi:predicted DNA-binding transcriptional regulator AlpA
MTFPDPMLTKSEVAELLRCCERTIERQVRDGAFPPAQRFGKESLWFQSVIHTWLNKRREAQMRWVDSATCPTAETTAPPVASSDVAPGAEPVVSPEKPKTARASRVKPRPSSAGSCSIFSPEQLGQVRASD